MRTALDCEGALVSSYMSLIDREEVLPAEDDGDSCVGHLVELLDLDPTAESSEEGANIDLDATRVGKSAVIKTSTRQTIFLPLIGLVDPETLKPGDLIGVNKDSYLILDTLPAEYDSRVKAMEVDEKPVVSRTRNLDVNFVDDDELQASLARARRAKTMQKPKVLTQEEIAKKRTYMFPFSTCTSA